MLTESAQRYVDRYGLPKKEILLVRFLPRKLFRPVEFAGGVFRIVAEQETSIGLDDCGRVYALEPPESTRFCNSSLEAFCMLLKTYDVLPELAPDCSEKVLREQAERMRAAVRGTDPAALESETYFWPVIIEQIGDGLL